MVERLQLFWEDQPPFIRTSGEMSAWLFGGGLLLHAAVRISVRFLSSEKVLYFNLAIALVRTFLWLLLALASYNMMRLLFQFFMRRGVVSYRGILVGLASMLVFALTLSNLPQVVNVLIANNTGRPYHDVRADVADLCERWQEEWGEQPSGGIELQVEEEDLGPIGEEAEVFRISNTVIFNFSENDQDFGLACVLNNAEPSDLARAYNYSYYPIDGVIFRFIKFAPEF